MSIAKESISSIIRQFSTCDNDTGSAEVQIALFTQHINNLTEHVQLNKNDHQSRKGLLSFVIKRKRLLSYLKNTNNNRYTTLIKNLKLKKI